MGVGTAGGFTTTNHRHDVEEGVLELGEEAQEDRGHWRKAVCNPWVGSTNGSSDPNAP